MELLKIAIVYFGVSIRYVFVMDDFGVSIGYVFVMDD